MTKRDGQERFSRDKLMKFGDCLSEAAHCVEQLERITDAITSQTESEFEREIPSIVLGRMVMEALVKLDEVAYIRYASVYRRFRDAGHL